MEHCYVDISGKAYPNQISLADDSFLPGVTKLAVCMKVNGTKAFLQLNHCGSLSSEKDIGMIPLSASDIRAPKSVEPLIVWQINHLDYTSKKCYTI